MIQSPLATTLHMTLPCNVFLHSKPSSTFLHEFFPPKNSANIPLLSCKAITRPQMGCLGFKPQQSQYSNGRNFQVQLSTEYEQAVEEMRQLLLKTKENEDDDDDAIESMKMVDAIQRSGVGKHFLKEMDTILDKHYYSKATDTIERYTSLHDVSLSFRLLRRQGYDVQADVFNGFKSADGKFREKLRHDERGLIELFEATQLGFEGEDILEEAQKFSRKNLHEYCSSDQHTNTVWSKNIQIRLCLPYHKTITGLTQRNVLIDTQGTKKRWKKTLKALVEMEFQMQQSLFQNEFLQVKTWWNELGLMQELKLARNQPLKWYAWSMTMLIDNINLSEERVHLTKPIVFVYLIDDIFDLYGSPDELAIFTEAVEKWDHAAIDTLPDYMKMCYKALLDTTNTLSQMIYKKHGHNPINYLKQTWVSLCNAFLVEAKWLAFNILPEAEEYLDNGKVSSGVQAVLVHLYFLLGLGGTKESEIYSSDISTLMSGVATILRLWDDLGSAKDENQKGRDGSYIDCYLKDNPRVSVEQAKEHVRKMIACEWKRLNKACFNLHSNSPATTSYFQEASLNLARMVPLMYSYDDNQRLPILEEYVDRMFFDKKSSDHSFHGELQEENSKNNEFYDRNLQMPRVRNTG